MRKLPLVTAILATLFSATAQKVHLSVGSSFDGAARPLVGVELRELRSGDTTSTLHFEVSDVIMVGLDVRQTETFGHLGNVIIELGGRLRTDASYEGRLGGRGVIGPLALGVALTAFNAPPAIFIASDAASDTRPITDSGVPGFGLEIDAEVRADRSLVVGVSPDFYLLDGLLAARLLTEVRLLSLFSEVDGLVSLQGYASPGFEVAHAAVGAGAVWRRRRAPIWSSTVWLGLGSGLVPGVSARVAERLGNGALLTIDLAAQPYRRDIAPYRFATTVTLPVGAGTIDAIGTVAYHRGTVGSVRLGYTLPLER